MATSGEAQIQAIQTDLACPGCEYNLRGLYGDVVNCPECGQSCDVVELIARRWTGPWFLAPGLNTLALPAVWTLVCSMAGYRSFLYPGKWISGLLSVLDDPIVAAAILLWFVVWSGLMFFAWRLFGNWKGAALAILAHLIVGAYVVGVVGFVASLIWIIATFWGTGPGGRSVLLVIVFGAMLVASYYGGRFTARQCIRQYLRRTPTS